jgi:hypothetical protein
MAEVTSKMTSPPLPPSPPSGPPKGMNFSRRRDPRPQKSLLHQQTACSNLKQQKPEAEWLRASKFTAKEFLV